MLKVRRFMKEDAEFCFKVRSRAFIIEFYDELGPSAVAAGVNAYMPSDYVQMSEEQEFFVAEFDHSPVAFFTLRREDLSSAEIPLIYLDLDYLGKGIGSWCIQYLEDWVKQNWIEVTTLFLDTVIPKYNGGFYRKMGFESTRECYCEFSGYRVPAIRFEKRL
jgi:GNAT superfamily N-acetyltransferase